jgi:tight adherence protein B
VSLSKSAGSGTQENFSPQATDYRTYKLTGREWIIYGGQGLAIAATIAYVCYRSVLAGLIFAPLAVIWPMVMRKELAARRYRQLEQEFREGIMTLSSAIAAGYSPENAMKEAESELRLMYGDDAMIVREFEMINLQVSMNIPLEKAWESFALRSGNSDIENFAGVIRIAKRSGGDFKRIISHTADIIGDKLSIKEEITTMTSGKQFEQKIMELIPVLIIIYIDRSSPGFFDPMYTTLTGRMIMTACLCIYAAAVWVSGRILNIAV